MAIGGRYQATEKLSVRAGYLFNTDPVPSARTLLNVELPAISQHLLAFGTSYKVTDDITFSLAYTHQFRNTMSGSIFQVSGLSVREDEQIDSVVAGLTDQFGGRRKTAPSTAFDPVVPPPPPIPAPAPGSVVQAEPGASPSL